MFANGEGSEPESVLFRRSVLTGRCGSEEENEDEDVDNHQSIICAIAFGNQAAEWTHFCCQLRLRLYAFDMRLIHAANMIMVMSNAPYTHHA